MALSLRSRHDREILSFAIPALGGLAAQPLYGLVDTAVVGHLGRAQLAALGTATTVMTVLALFNFLQYTTTAQLARARGAGDHELAEGLAAQALWLGLGIGVTSAALIAVFAPAIVAAVGSRDEAAEHAALYLRIVAIGMPWAFLTVVGQGVLRGMSDLRTPLLLVVAGNLVNIVLEILFVYAFGWGIAGAAWGTAIAQTLMGAGMAAVIVRRLGGSLAPPQTALARRLLHVGAFLFLRTTALLASFVLAGVFAVRLGADATGAHQISGQLFFFLALVLDALAVACQIIVARELGAGRTGEAYSAALRAITLATLLGGTFAVILTVFAGAIPRIFTADRLVLEESAKLWPFLVLIQPIGGAVFALDGILIGAGDGRHLALSMLGAALACVAALAFGAANGWGIAGVWTALLLLILVRLALLGTRFAGQRWLITGNAGRRGSLAGDHIDSGAETPSSPSA